MATLKCNVAGNGALVLCLAACPFADKLDQVTRIECDVRIRIFTADDEPLEIVFDSAAEPSAPPPEPPAPEQTSD